MPNKEARSKSFFNILPKGWVAHIFGCQRLCKQYFDNGEVPLERASAELRVEEMCSFSIA